MMKRIAVCSPTSSLEKNRAALLGNGADVYIATVSRRLRFQFGLKSYKPARKVIGERTAIRFIIRSSRGMFSLASHFYSSLCNSHNY